MGVSAHLPQVRLAMLRACDGWTHQGGCDMKMLLLLLGLIALTTAPVAGDVEFWFAQIGPHNNSYPGGG